jgi:hypothetical protein
MAVREGFVSLSELGDEFFNFSAHLLILLFHLIDFCLKVTLFLLQKAVFLALFAVLEFEV